MGQKSHGLIYGKGEGMVGRELSKVLGTEKRKQVRSSVSNPGESIRTAASWTGFYDPLLSLLFISVCVSIALKVKGQGTGSQLGIYVWY